jgi:hypothetical protein
MFHGAFLPVLFTKVDLSENNWCPELTSGISGQNNISESLGSKLPDFPKVYKVWNM